MILDLPAVRTPVKGDRRCGLEPWSEFVDGEEFLEALLVLVLRARVSGTPRGGVIVTNEISTITSFVSCRVSFGRANQSAWRTRIPYK